MFGSRPVCMITHEFAHTVLQSLHSLQRGYEDMRQLNEDMRELGVSANIC